VATFCPLNSRRIKRSRASERSDQAIKDDFHRSKTLLRCERVIRAAVFRAPPTCTALKLATQW